MPLLPKTIPLQRPLISIPVFFTGFALVCKYIMLDRSIIDLCWAGLSGILTGGKIGICRVGPGFHNTDNVEQNAENFSHIACMKHGKLQQILSNLEGTS